MIPSRFATEYPERCLQLLEAFEQIARERDLIGSFSVMLASSILLVPWERAHNRHPLTQEQGGRLQTSLQSMKKQPWLAAELWAGREPGDWRFARIMGNPNDVMRWQDDEGRRSFSTEANTISRRKVRDVFPVLRNALAHGNIIYLDQNGHEAAGHRVQHLAFLSRYEETEEDRAKSETYRLVTVREADFLPFIWCWADWVVDHHEHEQDLRVA
jgi:hypothetical protein